MTSKGNRRSAFGGALALAIILSFLPPAGGQTGPTIKIFRTVHDCQQFEETQVHPNRYVLSKGASAPWAPVIFDIETGKAAALPPLDTLPGVPRPVVIKAPGREAEYERNRLTLEGKYWTWREKQVVFYDAARGRAGLHLSQYRPVKFTTGDPVCKSCGGETKLIEQFGRFYCAQCTKYVDEKDYIRNTYVSFYADLDLAAMAVTSITELERNWDAQKEVEGIRIIGVDPEGAYLYYSNNIYFYGIDKTSGRIILHRFNIASRAVDWRYTVPAPVRLKSGAAPSYAVNEFHTPDLKKILFWEYDEGWAEHPGRGWLANPGPQGIVVDTAARSHLAVPITVTPYGQAFSRDGKYLLLGSNQTGVIHKISLESKREEARVQASRSIFKLIFPPASRTLLSFNKKSVEVFSWPELKKLKTIPLGSFLPGVKDLLVSEPMLVTADGRYAVISVLEPTGNGPWWAAKRNDGFHLLQITD